MRILKTALVYFVLSFAAAFALGAMRGLVVAPRVGPFWAVVIEAPLIMTACWLACGFAIRRFHPIASLADRAAIGGLWLALLLAGEIGVGLFVRRLSVTDTLTSLATPSGVSGLAALMVCALFPLVRR